MRIVYESRELPEGKIKVEFEIDKADIRYMEVKDFVLNKTISEYDEEVIETNKAFRKMMNCINR